MPGPLFQRLPSTGESGNPSYSSLNQRGLAPFRRWPAISLLAAFILAACSSSPQADIEAAVRSNLKDPASATFRDLRLSAHNTYACISWNAKNGFGGYGEWSAAKLIHTKSGWQVKDLEIRADMMHVCDQDALNVAESIASMRQ